MHKLLTQIYKPNHINEIIGQKHLVGLGGIINKMIETKNVFSSIFFGLPGIGKTSLAFAICNSLNLKYATFNPTTDKKEQLEKVLAKNVSQDDDEIFVLIIDEIHRMNRDKQDILLSYLEQTNLRVLATTTENPFFTVNPAIRSRCQIFELKPISSEDMIESLKKIVKKNQIKIDDDSIELIVENSMGDLRSAINVLDMIWKIYKDEKVDYNQIKKIIPNQKIVGSSYGNEFYDLQSAFHKSLRGSDCDASIYYLARLIKIGDLNSIYRRMIAMAYEDIGLANPNLLQRVILAVEASERVGMPEAQQILAATVIEMCLSPKSNSAIKAIHKALNDVETDAGTCLVPNHLKDTHYKSAKKLGYGKHYKFPHDYPLNWVEQTYLPEQIKNRKYYVFQNNEIEFKMNKNHENRKNDAKKTKQ